jgi:hypothetical protein
MIDVIKECFMPLLRRSLTIFLLLVCSIAGRANAAVTTNFSDQWWNPNESGWGASVLQQWDTLFIDLFVYGTDNKPTWFVAAAVLQTTSPAGHLVFTGDLYATNGPYFGIAFNPAAVSARKVGTLTFDATGVSTATLTYIVDGTQVVKAVTRQTWRYENLSGSYYGGVISDRTGCSNPANNGHSETPATFQITHAADNSIAILVQVGVASCTITGTYSQSGHMGQITNGRGPCGDGGSGESVAAGELELTVNGFSGRFVAVGDPGGDQCTTSARFGGIRR